MFYIENSNINKIINLLKTEKPEVIILFRRWINDLLGYKDKTINESISELEETGEMLATALKKHDEKLIKEVIETKALDTAKKMLAEGLDISLISRITGLSEKKIREL